MHTFFILDIEQNNILAICKNAIFSQGIVPSVPYLFVLFIILANEFPLFFISFLILIYITMNLRIEIVDLTVELEVLMYVVKTSTKDSKSLLYSDLGGKYNN